VIKKTIAIALMTAGMVFASHGLAGLACPSLAGFKIVFAVSNGAAIQYHGYWKDGVITTGLSNKKESKKIVEATINSAKVKGNSKKVFTSHRKKKYFYACSNSFDPLNYTNVRSGVVVMIFSKVYRVSKTATFGDTPADSDYSVQQKVEMLRGR